jgi:hypothetical protein
MIFLAEVFLEFLRKTDSAAGNTLNIAVNPQMSYLLTGEWIGVCLAH